MSDAPAHHLFVLLGPVRADTGELPDILCAVQVCLEGGIARQVVACCHGSNGEAELSGAGRE